MEIYRNFYFENIIIIAEKVRGRTLKDPMFNSQNPGSKDSKEKKTMYKNTAAMWSQDISPQALSIEPGERHS